MKKITVLPADKYIVVNKTVLHEEDRRLLTMLYQPIIGYTAVSLYFTLIDDLDSLYRTSEDLNHHHLMATMQLKLEEIIIAREKLEAVGLLKTYMKEGNVNSYVYLLYSPISANEFFNHPILNIVLYNNIGKKEYDRRQQLFKVPKINLKEYQDISLKFNDVFSSSNLKPFEVIDSIEVRQEAKMELNRVIDFDELISSIPSSMVSSRCFTEDVKELINSLAVVYQLDTDAMKGLVRNAINEKGLINREELRKSCRNYYQFENMGKLPTLIYQKQPDYLKQPEGDTSKWAKMVYTFENTSPYDYLKSKYKGAEPTKRDLRLIEDLMVEQKLSAGVVNVLISYALKLNHQKLNRNYLETIAGQWKRLNVETVEEAMRLTEKEYKKMKKIAAKNETKPKTVKESKEILPDWFNQEQTSEQVSKEEEEEWDKRLSSLV
ncbi:MAG TPA: DnaD domain protein [Candidatus Onthousia faecigallinarum]|nr:DnaD domain protein [Candidatus Onthousia faecigallinarum]